MFLISAPSIPLTAWKPAGDKKKIKLNEESRYIYIYKISNNVWDIGTKYTVIWHFVIYCEEIRKIRNEKYHKLIFHFQEKMIFWFFNRKKKKKKLEAKKKRFSFFEVLFNVKSCHCTKFANFAYLCIDYWRPKGKLSVVIFMVNKLDLCDQCTDKISRILSALTIHSTHCWNFVFGLWKSITLSVTADLHSFLIAKN